jgi:hypothetical protein
MITMKAVQLHGYGGTDQLKYEDVAIREPRPNEVPISKAYGDKRKSGGLENSEWSSQRQDASDLSGTSGARCGRDGSQNRSRR